MRFLIIFCVTFIFSGLPAHAQEPIKIGVISEHNLWAQMATNQKRGVDLAVEEINRSGGLYDGHKLEVLHRDGGSGTPADVLRDVEDLVQREGIRILAGAGPDNIGLAVSDYARRNKVFYLKGINGTNKHIWQEGHKYAFRFDVPNYMYGKVFAEAAAKTEAQTWALVAPDYEFGRSVVEDFKTALKDTKPDVKFTQEQWFPATKIDAGPVLQSVMRDQPDGIFFAGWGSDAVQFVREGHKRDAFKDKTVIGVLTGQPEQLEAMGEEAPAGWITQGYPYDDIKNPEHIKFLESYRNKYGENPGWFSFVGYNMIKSLAAVINSARSTDPDELADIMAGLEVETTAGTVLYRALDHQSNLGLWVGEIAVKEGKPMLSNWEYKSGDLYYPGDDYVKQQMSKN